MISASLGPKHGFAIWLLEIAPVLLALAVLIPTYRRFRLSDLAYRLVLVHACILTLGAHYTYAEVRQVSGSRMRLAWPATTTTG